MSQEIEVKFRIADPTPIREKLSQLGLTPINLVLETNIILDTPERRLLNAGTGLRVRTNRLMSGSNPLAATIAFKGPRESGDDCIKSREELETITDDPATLQTILSRLGYLPVIVYEKRRESWYVNQCLVTVDELPKLGWFVEIEAHSRDAIDPVREKIGIEQSAAIEQTYVRLTAMHGDKTPDGKRILLFED